MNKDTKRLLVVGVFIAVVMLLCARAAYGDARLLEKGETYTAPEDMVIMTWEDFVEVNDRLDELEICQDAYADLKDATMSLEADWQRYADEMDKEAVRRFWRGFGIGGAVFGGLATVAVSVFVITQEANNQ
jgi:hypothetical protein